MKRILLVTVLALVLTFATVSQASAQPVHDRVSAQVKTASAFDCAGALFFGGVTLVGSFFSSPLFAWLGMANTAYTADSIRRNQTCAAESFYDHIGYRELCWQAHFIGWSPTGSGHAMFDNKDGKCRVSPITADGILCDYIKPPQYVTQCVGQYIRDAVANVVNLTSHLWN